MPHLFANRRRLMALSGDDASPERHFAWETANAAIYVIGGVLFVAGSVLFFPRFEAWIDVGAWIFFVGSLLYLVVTGHDLAEVVRAARFRRGRPTRWDRLEFLAAVTYVAGTLLFTVGSVLFLSWVGLFVPGAWCFVFGSLLFVAGATVNVLQIVTARSLATLQLMNLTAIAFVVGSVLFTVASIPYLWTVADAGDGRMIDAFLAWQYVAGSLLFLAGGLFNHRRAWLVARADA